MAKTRSAQEPAPRKRYRKPGSLAKMRGMLWEALLELSGMIEASNASEDRKLRGMHAMAQLAGAYIKVVEVHDLAAQVAELQAAVKRSRGHA
jgi:hypothetical protein